METFRAADIASLRERLGLSISALAQKLGCPVDLVVAWELGQRFPTRKHTQLLNRLRLELEGPQSDAP